jgi:hypothetical protein
MSVVSINRFKEKNDREIIDFVGDKKFMVMRFDEEEGVDIMSNFVPGLFETTLIHMAYLYAAESLVYDEE